MRMGIPRCIEPPLFLPGLNTEVSRRRLMKNQKARPVALIPEFLGKDEMNLAEYPFSLLTHRTPSHLKTYTFTQQIVDGNGKTISQTWSILGSDKYGLPTPYDDDVILALLYCYKDQNFQGRKIHFTLYKLCHLMQKTPSKREYDRIRESLNRLTSTTIAALNCFYDNDAKAWVSETFHLFDRHRLYQERKGRALSLPLSFIEMGDVFYRSVVIANYIKNLDLETYYSLSLPTTKRLFRYLDKNRYNKSRYEESLMKMARKLPLSYDYPSQVKQKLIRAHDELLKIGYLSNVTYSHSKRGENKVIYNFVNQTAKRDRGVVVETSTAHQLVLDFYSKLIGKSNITYIPTNKELALAEEYLRAYGPDCATFIVQHSLKAAEAIEFPIQMFGGTKNFLSQALIAWEKRSQTQAHTETRQEEQMLEKYRRLTQERLSQAIHTLPNERLEEFEGRAKVGLSAQEGAIAYRLTVKIRRDELILHECLGYDIWAKLVEQLRKRLDEQTFHDIIHPCQLECVTDDTLILSVPNQQGKAILTQRYAPLIEELTQTQGRRYRIDILLRKEGR